VWDAVIVDTPSLGQFQSYLQAPATIAELVPTGNVRRQAAALAATLTDPDTTRIALVTTPAELPIIETLEIIESINTLQLGPPAQVVMNRLIPDLGLTMDMIADLDGGPLLQAARHQIAVMDAQRRWVNEIASDLELPFLMGVLTPGEVAAQLADTVGGP
jgi:anion-transporting  ArsA/GET3 family ATPase